VDSGGRGRVCQYTAMFMVAAIAAARAKTVPSTARKSSLVAHPAGARFAMALTRWARGIDLGVLGGRTVSRLSAEGDKHPGRDGRFDDADLRCSTQWTLNTALSMRRHDAGLLERGSSYSTAARA
jgi:hypothetical protein